jgi:hypothetical protein
MIRLTFAIRFTSNMTPHYATAIATQEQADYRLSLRRYLQCHVAGEIDFLAVQQDKQIHPEIDSPKHLNPQHSFSYEFHMSYVALRKAGAGPDPRGIREHISMIEPLELAIGSVEELICYDAQTSGLVIGRDDNDWKAYCNTDDWFQCGQTVEVYLAKDQDGPSGGGKRASDTSWNPREYFLLVLTQRLWQSNMEWSNVFSILMARLDSYVST